MKSTAVLFGCHDNTIVGTLAVCAATNINEIETVPEHALRSALNLLGYTANA